MICSLAERLCPRMSRNKTRPYTPPNLRSEYHRIFGSNVEKSPLIWDRSHPAHSKQAGKCCELTIICRLGTLLSSIQSDCRSCDKLEVDKIRLPWLSRVLDQYTQRTWDFSELVVFYVLFQQNEIWLDFARSVVYCSLVYTSFSQRTYNPNESELRFYLSNAK